MNDILLKKLKNFAVRINEKRIVFGSSYSLEECDFKNQILQKDISYLFDYLFNSDFFKNNHIIEKINNYISKAIKSNQSMYSNIVGLNQNKNTNNYCDFMFGVDVFLEPHLTFTIKILDFKLIDKNFGDYDVIFHDLTNEFDVIKHQQSIGKFVIDFKKDPNVIVGNDVLPKLLDLEKHSNNEYYISRTNHTEDQNQILRNKNFFIKSDLLLKDEISFLEDVWENNDKWLKVEAKILKRAYDGTPLLLGGVLYDITDFVKSKDAEYLQSIYEFAINSGSIGIFYYNHEKYPMGFFEANDIYAKMIGIEPNNDGLFSLDDFQELILPLEEDISSSEDIRQSLDNLLKGSIDGTTDDILKIRTKDTNEIKYLLSSSKIDSRYRNGKPKRFGGIIMDITERILVQKNQIEYAYRDQLTNLPNNRKLLKDMKSRNDGIGLFYDLDHFKIINDKYGHITGNEILKIFANTLTKLSMKHSKTHPYRLYGDEFFVYCDNVEESFGTHYNQELKVLFQQLVKKQYPHIKVEASVGVAVYNKQKSIDDFIKIADYAMYKEKILKNELKNGKQ
jgi:diguanylate cyclase (GGDEF)-like protein